MEIMQGYDKSHGEDETPIPSPAPVNVTSTESIPQLHAKVDKNV